jgi:hypothetical protein
VTPTCSVVAPGTGPTYLLLIGDSGTLHHNSGVVFELVAQTEANYRQSLGNKVVACRVNTIQTFVNALITNGFIGGGVEYIGHAGPYELQTSTKPKPLVSLLGLGNALGPDTNLTFLNVNQLQAVQTANTDRQILLIRMLSL